MTLATATTLSQAFSFFGVKSGHRCLILKYLFSKEPITGIAKTRKTKSGEATTQSAHENFEVLRELKNIVEKYRKSLSRNRTGYPQVYNSQFSLCAIVTTCVTMVRLCLLSRTDVPVIIFIT